MQQLSDIECVMQVVGGDTNAFGVLVFFYALWQRLTLG